MEESLRHNQSLGVGGQARHNDSLCVRDCDSDVPWLVNVSGVCRPICSYGTQYIPRSINGTGSCSAEQCPAGTVLLESARACVPVCQRGLYMTPNSTSRTQSEQQCIKACPLGSSFNETTRSCGYSCKLGGDGEPLVFSIHIPVQGTPAASEGNMTAGSNPTANSTDV